MKNYYWTKATYVYKKGTPLYNLAGYRENKLEQLVKASNSAMAEKAVRKQLEEDNDRIILQIRVDELIEGE